MDFKIRFLLLWSPLALELRDVKMEKLREYEPCIGYRSPSCILSPSPLALELRDVKMEKLHGYEQCIGYRSPLCILSPDNVRTLIFHSSLLGFHLIAFPFLHTVISEESECANMKALVLPGRFTSRVKCLDYKQQQ